MNRPDRIYERRRRRFSVVVLIASISIILLLFQTLPQPFEAEDTDIINGTTLSARIKSGEYTLASEVLGTLAVRESVSKEGYSRGKFGSGWARSGGCDMRNLILQRDLDPEQTDTTGCTVISGNLATDPYTGDMIAFQRGTETSSRVQIDHVVALSDAWQKGAQNLDEARRQQFANDPLNLLAVDGSANAQKGDKDASAWLPEGEFQCRYVARQIAVKARYLLWVTQSEYSAMRRVLAICPSQVLPIQTSTEGQ
ncbi:hypothetical protein BH23PAT2_BH23PAT2_06120 [soil metagenome]